MLAGVTLAEADLPLALGIIWATHIAIDRAVGYGLKSRADHHETHLGRMGKQS